jgi:hypothetical protein
MPRISRASRRGRGDRSAACAPACRARSSFALSVRLEASASSADGRQASARDFVSIASRRPLHDSSNDLAPSAWRSVANAPGSTPALTIADSVSLARPPVARREAFDPAVIGEMQQRFIGNRIDGVRCRQSADIKRVRGAGVFRAGARKQESLWARTPVFKWRSHRQRAHHVGVAREAGVLGIDLQDLVDLGLRPMMVGIATNALSGSERQRPPARAAGDPLCSSPRLITMPSLSCR